MPCHLCACSLCVGIIFIAYALQVKYKPFLDPNMDHATDLRAVTAEAKLVYVSPTPAASCRWPLTSEMNTHQCFLRQPSSLHKLLCCLAVAAVQVQPAGDPAPRHVIIRPPVWYGG